MIALPCGSSSASGILFISSCSLLLAMAFTKVLRWKIKLCRNKYENTDALLLTILLLIYLG